MRNEIVEKGLSMKTITKQARDSGPHAERNGGTSSLEAGERHEEMRSLGMQDGKWVETKQRWARVRGEHLKVMKGPRGPGWSSISGDAEKFRRESKGTW